MSELYEGVQIRKIAPDIGYVDDSMRVKGHPVPRGASKELKRQAGQVKLKVSEHKRKKPKTKFEEDPLESHVSEEAANHA